jgi:hypothetical protein
MAMRSRLACLGWATAATVGGLLSRRVAHALPQVIAEYAGDVLWAFMVFWLFAIVAPGARTALLAACAFATSVVVEVSQAWSAPWLVALRETRIGALVLGQGFLVSDLMCYAVGVMLAAAVDRLAFREHTLGE